jgi:hypothetical protein
MNRTRFHLLLLMAVFSLPAWADDADDSRLSAADYLEFESVSDPRISPDGGWIRKPTA